MKHVYFTCLLILAALITAPVSLMAQDPVITFPQEGNCGAEGDGSNLQWTLTDDGILTISGTGAMQDYNANPAPWMAYNDLLRTLIIEEGVTSIGDRAFAFCKGFIGSLNIPNGVTSIGEYAFASCKGFTGSLTIPNSVTLIGKQAFAYCGGLTGSLTIPNSVTSIGESAFMGCKGFTGSLTIPNSVESIGREAFIYCSGLTGEVVLPNSVISVGMSCFSGTGIDAIVFGEKITSIPSDIISGCSVGKITCLSAVPPTVDADFTGVDPTTCKLMIPYGAANDYKADAVWGKFSDNTVEVHRVSISAENGVITNGDESVLTDTVVEHNGSLTLMVVPDDGYELSALMVDGVDCAANVVDGVFAITDVTADMTIEAEFSPIIYAVKIYTVGSSVVFNHEVPYGGTFTVLLETSDGKPLQSVKVQEEEWIGSVVDGRLTVDDIREDKVIVIDATVSTPVDYAPEKFSDGLTVWTVDGRVFVATDGVMRSVEVFDLNGRGVLSVDVNATAMDFGVPQRHTAYVVKVYCADGVVRSAKVAVE